MADGQVINNLLVNAQMIEHAAPSSAVLMSSVPQPELFPAKCCICTPFCEVGGRRQSHEKSKLSIQPGVVSTRYRSGHHQQRQSLDGSTGVAWTEPAGRWNSPATATKAETNGDIVC